MAKKLSENVEVALEQVEVARPYPRVQKHFTPGTSKTRRSELASTDLKTLVNRWRLAGSPPPARRQFGDLTELPTTRLEAMQRIDAANEAFQALPLKVRQAVNHDYRQLEAWILANPQQAAEAGLIEIQKVPAPSPANPPSSGGAGEGESQGGGE